MTGSSWLAEDPTVSPRMVHDRDPATSWIADPRDPEPPLTVELPERRRLHRIEVTPPADIADVPTGAVIEADGEERVVDLQGDGRFEPLEARNFTITFSRPGDDVFTLGIGDLRLRSARLKVPLNGAGRTGAICGFGPPLVVDGIEVPTRVQGRIGAVAAAGQLAVRPCGPRIRLAAGQHRLELRSTEQFQPVALTLTAVGPHRGLPLRLLRVVDSDDTRHVLDVGPGEEAILSMPQNFNGGWIARVDGDELEPIQVDGWAQGWVLPEDMSGEVVLDFQPQRGYLVTLIAGLVLLGLVLLWAAWLALRHRLTEPPIRSRPRRTAARPPDGGRRAVPGRAGCVRRRWADRRRRSPARGAARQRPRLAVAVVTAALLGAVLAFVIQVAQDAVLPPTRSTWSPAPPWPSAWSRAFLAPNGKREDTAPDEAGRRGVDRRAHRGDPGTAAHRLGLLAVRRHGVRARAALEGRLARARRDPPAGGAHGRDRLGADPGAARASWCSGCSWSGAFLAGGIGAGFFVGRHGTPARLAAIMLMLWNPWVYERLLMGQWAILSGSLLLPGSCSPALRMRRDLRRGAPAVAVALVLSAVCSPSSGLMAALVVVVLGLRRSSRTSPLPPA